MNLVPAPRPRQAWWSRLALATVLTAITAPAPALDLSLGGFGSVAASCFSANDADFVINLQPTGPGRSGRCDAGLDSTLGVQADLRVDETLEFGVQAVADRNADHSFTPDVTVAQWRVHLGDATTVRIGRSPYPAFLHSETRMVKFVMPWLRPPMEVYGLGPVFTQDGVEVLKDVFLAGAAMELHAGIAQARPELPSDGGTHRGHIDQAFANVQFESRETLIKLGYTYGKTTFDVRAIDQLAAGLRTFGANSPQAALAEGLPIDNSDTHLLSFGAHHHVGDWLLQGEIAYRTIDSYFRDQIGAYLTIGRHLGRWTPFLTIARRATHGPKTDDRAGPLTGTVATLYASSRFDSTRIAFGAAREIDEQTTLKLQLDVIRPDDNAWGMYLNHAASYDFASPDTDYLLSVGIDFVF